jgi:signal transduction histidine kinase
MRVIDASEALRKEIAQYLHSSVQAKLIVVKTRLDILLNKARNGDLPDDAPDELRDLSGTLFTVIEEDIRPVSLRLFPAILRRGLVPALWSLSDQFEAVLPLDYDLDSDLEEAERNNPNYLSEQIKVTLYRIVENALTNAVRHAEAKSVKVRLEWDPSGELRLGIEDDGRGFDVATALIGTGLGTMRDYAQSVDGSCEIVSVPGEGTSITATVPVPAYATPK